MIHCLVCEKTLPDTVKVCPGCGAPVTKLIKEPKDHGFHFLVVNLLDVPNDC